MILIAGAAGDLGAEVTRILLRQGTPVQMLVSSPAQSRALASAGARPMTGNLHHSAFLTGLCSGARAVAAIMGCAGHDGEQALDLPAALSLIDAAKASGVEHFLFTAELCAPRAAQVLDRAEAALKASGLPYTVIAAEPLMEHWPMTLVGEAALTGGPVAFAGASSSSHRFVAMVDVAHLIVSYLRNGNAVNGRLIVGGPEALSLRDVVAIYGWLLGRRIEIQTSEQRSPSTALVGMEQPLPAGTADTGAWAAPTSLEVLVKRSLIARDAIAGGV